MADQSDVALALVERIVQRFYPNGPAQPSAIGAPVLVHPGWPGPNQVQADTAAGKVTVSVWPTTTEGGRAYFENWGETNRAPVSLAAAVSGTSVTFSGTGTPGQGFALLIDAQPFAVAAVAGDTPATIAAKFGTAIGAQRAASVTGAVITVPNARVIEARPIGTGTAASKLRRESRVYQVTVWARSPALRDAAGRVIQVFASGTRQMDMPDHTHALLRYASSRNDDDLAKQGIYRRDLFVRVDSDVIETETQYTVAVVATATSGGQSLDEQGPPRITHH